ncbi:hypothetical protein RchiOBHm_Chr3g0488361 [Rosa chinensis]|uniref:Uncharacterized protein n=1 Tax=Rosa chinensis TaxID=74649 RepID=A0A2P6RFS2_ROSCH|nr:hypothetical protein RchiOBHm_Chr3g0488361 [Rosa chinensis]
MILMAISAYSSGTYAKVISIRSSSYVFQTHDMIILHFIIWKRQEILWTSLYLTCWPQWGFT